MILVHSPSNRRPRRLEHKHTLNSITLQLLSSHRVQNSRFDTKERHSGATWLGFDGTRERRDDDTASFGLPEGIDDGAFALADMVVVPVPCLGVDRLTDGTEDAERGEVVALDVVVAETTEETDGGGSGVELGEFVLLDGLPVARGCRVDRCRLEDGCGYAVGEGTVDDVTVDGAREMKLFEYGKG